MGIKLAAKNVTRDLTKNSGVKQVNDNFNAIWNGMNKAVHKDEMKNYPNRKDFNVIPNAVAANGSQSVIVNLGGGVKLLTAYFEIPYKNGGNKVTYLYPEGTFTGTTSAPVASLFLPNDDWENYGVCPVDVITWDLNGVTIKSEMDSAQANTAMVTFMVFGN